jgi:hypothetical protein
LRTRPLKRQARSSTSRRDGCGAGHIDGTADMMAANSSSVAAGCTREMNIDAAFDSLTAECFRACVVEPRRVLCAALGGLPPI